MENSLGFKQVEYKEPDPRLVKIISERRNVPENTVKNILSHHSWTVKQFACLTGKTVQTINNFTNRGRQVNKEWVVALNVCYPFPDFDSDGPKFIVRDDLSIDMLLKSLR